MVLVGPEPPPSVARSFSVSPTTAAAGFAEVERVAVAALTVTAPLAGYTVLAIVVAAFTNTISARLPLHAVVTDLLLAFPPYTACQRHVPSLSGVKPGDVANRNVGPEPLSVNA